jgi:hypothetical protein
MREKLLISLAILLGYALPSEAQITAALNRLPDGSIEIGIRNGSSAGLTAFAIKVDHVSEDPPAVYVDPDTVYVDTAIDLALPPLQPNQQYTFQPRLWSRRGGPAPLPQVISDERKQLPMQVDLSKYTVTTAGIYAGGTTSGDPGLLTRLLLRRGNMLLAVELTLEAISDAGRRNIPPAQLIGRFKELADSVRRGYLLPEQRVGLALYQAMAGKLSNVPPLEPGAPFPPGDFVQRETALLRQQRAALVESQPSLFHFGGSSR